MIEYCSTSKVTDSDIGYNIMTLELTEINEISQSQKDKYCIVEKQNSQNHKRQKMEWRRGEWEMFHACSFNLQEESCKDGW